MAKLDFLPLGRARDSKTAKISKLTGAKKLGQAKIPHKWVVSPTKMLRMTYLGLLR